ncbi:Coiled-coil domain-containing protein 91 [Manis javanica]|nr:Coiled-coil domain-containing protein 91 [Manis javanica]
MTKQEVKIKKNFQEEIKSVSALPRIHEVLEQTTEDLSPNLQSVGTQQEHFGCSNRPAVVAAIVFMAAFFMEEVIFFLSTGRAGILLVFRQSCDEYSSPVLIQELVEIFFLKSFICRYSYPGTSMKSMGKAAALTYGFDHKRLNPSARRWRRRERGAGELEKWMMTTLVVLRLRRFLMVEMVKPKLHLLPFLGLLFLQCLESIFLQLLLRLCWTMTAAPLPPAALLLSPSFRHQRMRAQTTAWSARLFLKHRLSNQHLQQKISSLETKLKVSEEEKQRIKKDVESLMENHSVLEKDFLKEKEQEAISLQDRYKQLQEKHKQELEDMRKAGHEALSIIVDEYKALLQSSVKQQVEAVEKQYISAIEKQSHKCEELLNAQHQRLLEILDAEKELLKEKVKEALLQQSQEQKEILEKCLEEERKRNKEALASAAKLEKEAVKDAVLKAIEEERKNLEKAHADERELWKAEHANSQEKVSQAIQKAIQEQKKISQETVKAAIIEEQQRSEKAVEEAVKRTRDELIDYVKEQKRLDQVIRQRSLSSLELFLSCAQKQLSALIATEPVDIE